MPEPRRRHHGGRGLCPRRGRRRPSARGGRGAVLGDGSAGDRGTGSGAHDRRGRGHTRANAAEEARESEQPAEVVERPASSGMLRRRLSRVAVTIAVAAGGALFAATAVVG